MKIFLLVTRLGDDGRVASGGPGGVDVLLVLDVDFSADHGGLLVRTEVDGAGLARSISRADWRRKGWENTAVGLRDIPGVVDNAATRGVVQSDGVLVLKIIE